VDSRSSAGPPPDHTSGAHSLDPRRRLGLLPLRMFLGATFAYAGLQKLSDPGFFRSGAPTYIGTQLQVFGAHSPIGLPLQLMVRIAPVAGAMVIVLELTVGLLVLLGIFVRWAAVAGAALNAMLFLSATWQVQPYFLGSDSIYTVAWITLALMGDGEVLSLQGWLRQRPGPLPNWTLPTADPARRAFLYRIGATAVGVVWLLALWPRPRLGAGLAAEASGNGASATPAAGTTSPPSSPTGPVIGSLSQLQAQGGSLPYTDPHSGDPAVVVDLGSNQLVAYDAVCPHAGCTVGYDPSYKLLVCPCHGAVFDPAHGAAVLRGPAAQPLPPLQVVVGADGQIHGADGQIHVAG